MSERESVVVVGAGVIGLASALFLLRAGYRVTLIDRGPMQETALEAYPRTRVLALNPASISILKELSVWQSIKALRFQDYTSMQVVDERSGGEISFNSAEILSKRLGIIIEEQVLKNALLAALKTFERLTLLEHTEIEAFSQTDEGVCLTIAGDELKVRALFAADGANSSIRKFCGIFERRKSYGQQSLVVSLEHEESHQAVASQVFGKEGPLAFLPLYQEHLSSIVWSLPPARIKELLALSEPEFIKALERAFLGKRTVSSLKSPRVSFPLNKRHASCYHQGHVVLLGDAICGIHPLAGQGMNLGFRELANLMALHKEQADSFLTQQCFQKYSERCRSHNQTMLLGMDFLKGFFSKNNKLPKGLVSQGMNLVSRFSPVKRKLIELASGQL